MLKTFSITDIGKLRELNQDYVFTSEEPVGTLSNLFIVVNYCAINYVGDDFQIIRVNDCSSSTGNFATDMEA